MKKYLYTCFALVFILASCQPTLIEPTQNCDSPAGFTINPDHPKADAFEEIMNRYIAKGIPGVSVLIHDDNGFWFQSAGYADIENQVEMAPCHINKLGSVTKMMVGSLVWLLIQDGVLKIDDPMSKYLPEVAANIENGNDITLGMLIRHSAGVYDIAGDLNFNLAVINDFTKSWTAEDMLNYLEGKPARHLPDEKIQYSNSHTLLVSMIIEAATGRNHSELLSERILDPLGMDQTIYYNYGEAFPAENLAQGYLDFHNDGGKIQNISLLNPGSGQGFTGVYSNVFDLYTYINALLREKTLITPENLEIIFDSFRFVESGNWGTSLGAIHNEYRDAFSENVFAYGHAGGDVGYSSNLNYFPHNNTIIAVTYNYGTNLRSDLGRELNELRRELVSLGGE